MIFNEERILGGLTNWINDRNSELKKAEETHDFEIKERFGPETFGEHEALDRAHMLTDTWARFVEEHPGVLLKPDAYRWAALATYCMMKTYESIAKKPDPYADNLIADIKRNFNTKGAETGRTRTDWEGLEGAAGQ